MVNTIHTVRNAHIDLESQQCWFAVHVKTRHEKATAATLAGKGYEVFLPLYKASRNWAGRRGLVDLPLFQNYIFCRFEFNDRLPILKTPGVMHIVTYGSSPAPVDPHELEYLRKIVTSSLAAEPCTWFERGQKVKLVCGPLKQVEGIVVDVNNRSMLIVSITLLQRSVAVEIDPLWLHPSPSGSYGMVQSQVASNPAFASPQLSSK